MCMCIGVLLVGAMRLGREGFPCPIVQLVPAHKRGFRDMIPAEYEVYVFRLAVQPYCALLCAYGVWQITLAVFLLLCYDIHGD